MEFSDNDLFDYLDNNDIMRAEFLTELTNYIEENNLTQNKDGIIHGYQLAKKYYKDRTMPKGFKVSLRINKFPYY
jgi:DNA integrity scanning protein DisA with diadenylate cyclase activity